MKNSNNIGDTPNLSFRSNIDTIHYDKNYINLHPRPLCSTQR